MNLIRLASGMLGGVLVLLALIILFAGFGNTDLVTEIVLKSVMGALLLAGALFLLHVSTGLKKRWVPVFVLGWALAVCAPLQLLYSVYEFDHAADLGARIVSGLVALLIPPTFLLLGGHLIKFARRADARSRSRLAPDPRPPILYLRPFSVDPQASRVTAREDMAALAFNTRTEEEQLAQVVGEFGPCVAIGRPGERLPQLGFKRLYVSNEEWQATVLQFLSQAQLVILMGGSSRNYAWEFHKAVELVEPQRLLLLIPADAKDRTEFGQLARQLLPGVEPEIPPKAIIRGRTFQAILYFGRDWTAHYAVCESPGHFRRTLMPSLVPALRMALRPVYAQLDWKWTPPPLVLSRILYEGAVVVFALFFLRIILFNA
jgi:hypothetical protein